MPDVTVSTLLGLKQKGEKIAMLTAYDATFAQAACQAGVEVLLVGDSLGMVLQGHDSTLPVSLADMAYHTAAVKRGNQGALILADLPFMAYATLEQTFASSAALMQAGAHMIKLEGASWLAEPIRQLAERGVPVCAAIGEATQAVNVFGGYKVQGRGDSAAAKLRADARAVADAGAQLLVLECVPSPLAAAITADLAIPTIGIGAGPGCDGQVLVLHDFLGLDTGHRRPKFVKDFLAEGGSVPGAVRAYAEAVRTRQFPGPEHAYA